MPLQILVHIQGVQFLCVKPSQEHTHDNQQVKRLHIRSALLHTLVDVIIIEAEMRDIVCSAEHSVVVIHYLLQLVGGHFLILKALSHSGKVVILTLVRCVSEYRADADRRFQFLEYPVIFKEHRDGLDSEHRVELTVKGGMIEVVQYEPRNLPHPCLRRQVHIFLSFVVFNKEAKHIIIRYGILDQVPMQTFPEHFRRGMLLSGIFRKDRCSGKSEHLEIVKESDYILVAVTEVGAVTFIEYHHHLLVSYILKVFVVIVLRDGTVKLLNCGDDDLGIPAQPSDQFVGVVGTVNRPRLERFIFSLRLRVKVVSVHHEQHLVDAIDFRHQLGGLERGQCLSSASGMPDISVVIGLLYFLQNLLHCIILIRAEHHQHLVSLVKDNVLAYNLSESTFRKEIISEKLKVVHRLVIGSCPVERELVASVGIIRKISCVDSIGDDEKLDVVEKSVERRLLVPLNLIVCLFQFYAPFL